MTLMPAHRCPSRGHKDAHNVAARVGLDHWHQAVLDLLGTDAGELNTTLEVAVLCMDGEHALLVAGTAAAGLPELDISDVVDWDEIARGGTAAMRHLDVVSPEDPLGAAAAAEAHAAELQATP